MPKPFPREFRDDVVRVALNRDPDVPLAQIAKDFGIHVGTLDKWLRQARIDAGGQMSATLEDEADPTLENEATGSCCLVCRVLGLDARQGVNAAVA